MKIRLSTLRRIVREELFREYGEATGASGSDPTDVKGFYPYEIERGTDIHGYWYRSPGRSVGSDGDPFRPADAAEYIGMKRKAGEEEAPAAATPVPAAPPAKK